MSLCKNKLQLAVENKLTMICLIHLYLADKITSIQKIIVYKNNAQVTTND